MRPLGDGFYSLVVAFGYMEEPMLLPVLHQAAQASGIPLDTVDTTYYVGHETIVVHDEATINRIPEIALRHDLDFRIVFGKIDNCAPHSAFRADERHAMPPETLPHRIARQLKGIVGRDH